MAFQEMNLAAIIGNLTSDPKYTKNGDTAILNFAVALSERVKVGEKWDDGPPTFIPVVCFGKIADTANTNLAKGTKVAFHGRLRQERWKNKEGAEQSRLVVVADHIRALDRLRPKAAPAEQEELEDCPV